MARKGRNWWFYLFNQVHGSQPAVTKCDHAGGSCCLFPRRGISSGAFGKTHILIVSDMHEIISFFEGNLSSVVFFRESNKRSSSIASSACASAREDFLVQRQVHVDVQEKIFQRKVKCVCKCKRRSSSVRSSASASAREDLNSKGKPLESQLTSIEILANPFNSNQI